MHVECAGDVVRFEGVKVFFQNRQQTVYGVCGEPVFRRKRTYPIECAVDDAVAVYNKKFLHGKIKFLGENLFKEKVFPEPLSKTF